MTPARALAASGPVRRLPPAWRAAFDGFASGRPLPFLAAFALGAGVVMALGDRAAGNTGGVARLFLVLVVAGGLVRGMVSGDRRGPRWILLFQRPFTPVRYYARVLTLSALAVVALFFLAGAAASVTALLLDSPLSARPTWGALAGASLTALQLLAVGTLFSALARRHDLELLLLLYFLSLFQGVLARVASGDLVPRLLAIALLPVDALSAVTEFLATGAPPALAWWQLLHAIAYPLVALFLAWLVIRSFNRRDLPPDTV